MAEFDENLIKVQSVTVKGNLPNPFVFNDGTPVTGKEDWALRRQAETGDTLPR